METIVNLQGRSPDSYSKMIEHVVSYRTQNESCGGEGGGKDGGEGGRQPLRVSVELEKQRPELVRLAPLADLVRASSLASRILSLAECMGRVELSLSLSLSSPFLPLLYPTRCGETGSSHTRPMW